MATIGNRLPLPVLQRRAIGVIWTLVGMVPIYDVLSRDYWKSEGLAWLPILMSGISIGAGIGFLLGCNWARVAMWMLVSLAGMVFTECLMVGVFEENRAFAVCGLSGCALTACTILYLFLYVRRQKGLC